VRLDIVPDSQPANTRLEGETYRNWSAEFSDHAPLLTRVWLVRGDYIGDWTGSPPSMSIRIVARPASRQSAV
jgi:hypothetical protein